MCGGDPEGGVLDIKSQILFPACAGVILTAYSLLLAFAAFPRMCGGDPLPDMSYSRK